MSKPQGKVGADAPALPPIVNPQTVVPSTLALNNLFLNQFQIACNNKATKNMVLNAMLQPSDYASGYVNWDPLQALQLHIDPLYAECVRVPALGAAVASLCSLASPLLAERVQRAAYVKALATSPQDPTVLDAALSALNATESALGMTLTTLPTPAPTPPTP